MSFHCHLDYIVSGKNSSDILIFVSLCCFLLIACKNFPVSLVFSNLIIMFLSVVLCFFCLDFVEILKAVVCRFHQIWKSFGCYFFNYFFFSLFSRLHVYQTARYFFTHHWYSYFFSSAFSLCTQIWRVSFAMSLLLQIFPLAVLNLL